MRFAFLLVALALLPSTSLASDAASLSQPVTLTRAEVLMLQTGVLNEQLSTELAKSSEPTPFQDVSITLTDAHGRMHVDILLDLAYARQLQGQTPAKQMEAVQGFRMLFGGLLLAAADLETQKIGLFSNIESHPASSPIVDAWVRSMSMDDVVLNLGFEHNGQPQLYATASRDGVVFETSAPNLR